MATSEVPRGEVPTPDDLPTPAPSPVNPGALRDFRTQLSRGENAVDPTTWAGSVPAQTGIAPRVRVGRSKWFNLLWLLLIVGVGFAKELREVPAAASFIADYPGTVPPPDEQDGIPAWVGWQHFLNLFLMTFIIRSGVQIMTDHPRLYWTRHSTPSKEWFRFQKEVPVDPLWTAKQDSVSLPGQVGLPGIRHSIGLPRWWHLGIDVLFVLNGLIFYILIPHRPAHRLRP